jgi:imidazolonepropionase-like amidohydrolase
MKNLKRFALLATVMILEVIAQASSPASGEEIRHTLLMGGNTSGSQTTQQSANGGWRFVFEYSDRGRGPSLTEHIALGADGTPTSSEIDGRDYLKNEVKERFAIVDQTARWKNSVEEGSKAHLPGVSAFYLGIDGTPGELGLLARALLSAPNRTLPLLPEGEARIEHVATLEVKANGFGRDVMLYEISGLSFTPTQIWLDGDGGLFAQGSEYMMMIREGWESAVERLLAAQTQRCDSNSRASARTLARRPGRPLVFTHGRMFDPQLGLMLPDQTIVVSGNRISQVGPEGGVKIPANAEVVDAAGKTILPGLWDMHSHLELETDGLLNIAAGVTSVRDLAHDTDELVAARQKYDEGTTIGPRVIMAGILEGPGRFAAPTKVLVNTPEEVTEAIDLYRKLGYDQIKVYNLIKPELVPLITEKSHAQRRMRVSGHVPMSMTAEQVVKQGFDELNHMAYLFLNFSAEAVKEEDPFLRIKWAARHGAELDLSSESVQGLIALLKESKTVVDPTLGMYEQDFTGRPGTIAAGVAPVADRLPPTVRRKFLVGGFPVTQELDGHHRASFEAMLKMLGSLHRAGVTLVAGTDALAGFYLHHELELYVRAGIPAPEVLRIATLGAAAVMSRDQELGSITPGKLADLIVVDGDPAARISDIRRVELVLKDGTVYKPAELYRALGVRAEGGLK